MKPGNDEGRSGVRPSGAADTNKQCLNTTNNQPKTQVTRAILNKLLRDPRLRCVFGLDWAGDVCIARPGAPDIDFNPINERQITQLLMMVERIGNLKTVPRSLFMEMLRYVASHRVLS